MTSVVASTSSSPSSPSWRLAGTASTAHASGGWRDSPWLRAGLGLAVTGLLAADLVVLLGSGPAATLDRSAGRDAAAAIAMAPADVVTATANDVVFGDRAFAVGAGTLGAAGLRPVVAPTMPAPAAVAPAHGRVVAPAPSPAAPGPRAVPAPSGTANVPPPVAEGPVGGALDEVVASLPVVGDVVPPGASAPAAGPVDEVLAPLAPVVTPVVEAAVTPVVQVAEELVPVTAVAAPVAGPAGGATSGLLGR